MNISPSASTKDPRRPIASGTCYTAADENGLAKIASRIRWNDGTESVELFDDVSALSRWINANIRNA